jgi:hypothetical protein
MMTYLLDWLSVHKVRHFTWVDLPVHIEELVLIWGVQEFVSAHQVNSKSLKHKQIQE